MQREVQTNGAVSAVNPLEAVRFEVEDRLVSTEAGTAKRRVQQALRPENVLSLDVPLATAVNREQVAAFERRRTEAEARGQKLYAKEYKHKCSGL